MAASLCVLLRDRGLRRYLALHDPAALHQAQRALAAWEAENQSLPVG